MNPEAITLLLIVSSVCTVSALYPNTKTGEFTYEVPFATRFALMCFALACVISVFRS